MTFCYVWLLLSFCFRKRKDLDKYRLLKYSTIHMLGKVDHSSVCKTLNLT